MQKNQFSARGEKAIQSIFESGGRVEVEAKQECAEPSDSIGVSHVQLVARSASAGKRPGNARK